ncbi:DUF3152 domain-containing protein [Corynebacterium gerontici]|uniref:DUF3152 domain-containing protein n=1 Tax=Corynebacterium gerontici TaxID=2079234 RepID=A0A3G6J3A1_9CORY|nr:DUF3152 domain-containing protein [Corynebacterium gerontici]AZA10890.1 hypothetical protein CGERO_02830 [Corynebacterium gerontici]
MRFARNYGWRAYAIPVLIVLTVWVLVDVFRPEPESPKPGSISAQGATEATMTGPRPADSDMKEIPNTELPSGAPYTEQGKGTYRTVGKPGAKAGTDHKKVFRYVVEVEEGLDASVYGGDDAFAAMVDATLTNPKGWTHDKEFGFEHIDADDGQTPDLRIQLSSVGTTHEVCGHDIAMETSCFYSDGNRVMINESRWIRGATPFQGDLGAYRQYLINHEVGHGIGFANHVPCTGNGDLAPIMMQQTLSLSNTELSKINSAEVYKDDGAVCAYNAWPYPRA